MSGFLYDSLGRLTHQYLPEKARSLNEMGEYIGTGNFSDVFTYDSRSNLTSHTDARGIKTIYDYKGDPLNRLGYVSYDITGFGDTTHPILPATGVDLSYVSTGDVTRLEVVTTGATKEEFGYNDRGLLSAKTLTLGWPKNFQNFPLTIGYQYDKFDRLSEITYPEEYGGRLLSNRRESVYFEFDLAGRPTDVKIIGGAYASSIAYNPASQITSLITGSGSGLLTERFDFDSGTGLLNHQQVIGANGPLLDLSYDYQRGSLVGRSGQVTNITNHLDEFHNRKYEYDVLGRLTEVTLGITPTRVHHESYWTQQYAYDAYGNRTKSKAFGPVKLLQNPDGGRGGSNITDAPELPAEKRDGLDGLLFDPYTNRISTPGYAYDAEGNTVRAQRPDGTWQRFQYDAAGRLVSITDDSGASLEQVMYGAGRQRLAKGNVDQLSSSYVYTFYAWSGDQVIAEYTETAAARDALTWTQSYVYLGGRLLATRTPDVYLVLERVVTTTPGPEPSHVWRRSVSYHHGDRVGPRLVTDAAGHSVSHEPYSFGTEAPNTATGGDTRRFTSYDRSMATGLDYAVNRYYDPATGRFTQVDPIGINAGTLANPQSLNMYAYVANDPVNAVDPTGLRFTLKVFCFLWSAFDEPLKLACQYDTAWVDDPDSPNDGASGVASDGGGGGGGGSSGGSNDYTNDKIDQLIHRNLNKAIEKDKKCEALARDVRSGNEPSGWALRDPVANAQRANYLFNALAWADAAIVSRFAALADGGAGWRYTLKQLLQSAGPLAGGTAAYSGVRFSDYVNANIAKYQADLRNAG